MPSVFADAILVIHVMFVAIVVLSVPLIALGGLLGWRWVRNPAYRFTHLGMIAFVACEALVGMACPLTVWENALRERAGKAGYGGRDFIASWLDKLLFYNFPQWVFTVAYVVFALLVASLFYLVPIRLSSKER